MDSDVHMGSPPKRRRIDLSAQNTVYTSNINPLDPPVTRLTDLPFSSPTHFVAALPPPPDPVSSLHESIQSIHSEEEDTLEDMRGPRANGAADLLGIEDISDSQWQEAEVIREKRVESRSSEQGASSSARNISSSMPSPRPHLVVDLSDSPTQASIKTPRATSPAESESEPIEWPTSPICPPKRQKLVSDSEEDEQDVGPSARNRVSPVKKRKLASSPSPEAEAVQHAILYGKERSSLDEANPEDDATGIMDMDFGLSQADWQAAAAALGPPDGPSLDDLFADDEDELPPPRAASGDNDIDVDVDLVNDDDDDYDWDNFPMPDLDDFAIPGPSTTTTVQSNTKAPAPLTSSSKPPPVIHPIVPLSDMPPDEQDFYRNHWRRGANKANPKTRALVDDGDGDMSGSDDDRFGVKMPTRNPPSRGRARGGWGFRGRGRGRARGRGRGRGR